MVIGEENGGESVSVFRKSIGVFIIICLVLTGCFNKQSPEEKIHETLEKVVEAEKDFVNQQDPLVDLEKKEKEIFEQIMKLGMKEYDQIVKLADKGIKLVDERKNRINIEQASLVTSKEEFVKVEKIINEFEDKKIKKQALKLNNIMLKRYAIHDDLYKDYKKGLEYDKELYDLFKNKDVTLDQIEKQITKINDAYEKVLKENEAFNKQTELYNKEKLIFYRQAGFDVQEKK